MGDCLTDEKSKQTSPTPYGDIFDRLFPHYLVMGMTPEQYWDGESGLKKAYREAYRIRRENEDRIADRNMWLQGMYIRDALQSVAYIVNGFAPKGAKLEPYPDKPRLEKAEEEKREEVQKKKEENQMTLAMAMMQAFADQFNKNRAKKQQKAQEAAENGET